MIFEQNVLHFFMAYLSSYRFPDGRPTNPDLSHALQPSPEGRVKVSKYYRNYLF